MTEETAKSPSDLALEFVDARRFEEAAVYLRQEISKDDLSPDEKADLFSLLGNVLYELGQMDEAVGAYRNAVTHAVHASPRERSCRVSILCYMLACHLLNMNDPAAALAEAESALEEENRGFHDLLHAVAAEALREMGRDEEARSSATAAVTEASSDKRRLNLRRRLAGLLSDARAG